jgi:hypothetical protein
MKIDETAFFEPPAELAGTLVCVAGTVAGRSFPLGRTVFTIGRSSSSSLVLENEPGVSKDHAKIELGIPGFVLTDLQSRNGTFVNGKRVDTVKLSDGDEVHVCGCVLRFALKTTTTATSSRPAPQPRAALPREGRSQETSGSARRSPGGAPATPAAAAGGELDRPSSTKNAVTSTSPRVRPGVPAERSSPAVMSVIVSDDGDRVGEATEMVAPERVAALLQGNGGVKPTMGRAVPVPAKEASQATRTAATAARPTTSSGAVPLTSEPGFDPDKTTIASSTEPRFQPPPRAGAVRVPGAAAAADVTLNDDHPNGAPAFDDGRTMFDATYQPAAATSAKRSTTPSSARQLSADKDATPTALTRSRPTATTTTAANASPPAGAATAARPPPPRTENPGGVQVTAVGGAVPASRSEAPPDATVTPKAKGAPISVVARNAFAGMLLVGVMGVLATLAPWQQQSSAGRKVPLPPRSPVDMKIQFVQQWCPDLPCAKPLAALANDDDTNGNAEAAAATDPCYRECLSIDQ